MNPKCTLFCAGAMGQPAWFAQLVPQFMGLQLKCIWPPTAPQQAWDPRWTSWDEEAIKATLCEAGFALWFLDTKGTPAPGFQRELQLGRSLWSEGALRGMAYIDVMRPSYMAHNAPAGVKDQISLAVQCMPGASRSVLAPNALPAYLAARFLPLIAKDEAAQDAREEAPRDLETEAEATPSPTRQDKAHSAGEVGTEP